MQVANVLRRSAKDESRAVVRPGGWRRQLLQSRNIMVLTRDFLKDMSPGWRTTEDPTWENLEWVIRSSMHSITASFQKLRRKTPVNQVRLQFLEYEALFNHFQAVVDNFRLIEFAGITSNFFKSCIKS